MKGHTYKIILTCDRFELSGFQPKPQLVRNVEEKALEKEEGLNPRKVGGKYLVGASPSARPHVEAFAPAKLLHKSAVLLLPVRETLQPACEEDVRSHQQAGQQADGGRHHIGELWEAGRHLRFADPGDIHKPDQGHDDVCERHFAAVQWN